MADDDRETLAGQRKKSSVVGNISCCFNGAGPRHRRRATVDESSFSCAWFKPKSGDLPEAKGRPSGGGGRRFFSSRHRRHSSADFSYDPLSYALNFDDDNMGSSPSDSDWPAVSFSARLPLSPPGTPPPGFSSHRPPPSPRPSELRRGFEALSVGVKEMRSVGEQRTVRNNNNSSNNNSNGSKSDKEVASPMEVSPNKEILVELC
ncbi:NHL domain-containing protein [Striga asiatica]|uniref:NHL domain-containing protein n=1 Tax=Striga asiatica TaxID=4170 RepID=A0A5A7R1Z3_STRAF|nr:NHL domain-containing protein [Striga asiatica]